MSDSFTDKMQTFAETFKQSADSELISAAQKFLGDVRRARKMEIAAIETFDAVLKRKQKTFKQPANI